ncbi:glycosyltransferase [Kocuria sp. M1R5S2]|uniref:glycosyltransferase n=1 Tax=Kocuria rhizosphaerae TaxID=3376285 RepID=UPI0037A4CD74
MTATATASRDGTTTTAPAPIALWVVPGADLGGVARHVLDVARAGLPGHRLVVLCPEGPLAERLRELRTAVVTGAFGTQAGPVASEATLRRVIRTLQPAVVHSHLSFADVVAAATLIRIRAERRVGLWSRPVPLLVTTEHGIARDDAVYHESPRRARTMAHVHRERLKAFDAVLAVSEATHAAMVEKWRARGVRVVHNGVDRPAHPRTRTTDPEAPHLLSLARLAPEKDLPTLLRAFARIVEGRPGATLEIAGTGALGPELEALAIELGVVDRVRFPGFVDAQEAMARADLVVQLSVWENCSYTLLDAVAHGVPVVATKVGGNPEILPESALASFGDVEAVAESIEHQLDAGGAPELPLLWPDVAAMAGRIAQQYRRAAGGRT